MKKEALNMSELIRQYRPRQLLIRPNKIKKENIQTVLYGIVAGDVIGCPYEGKTLEPKFLQQYMSVDLLDEKLRHTYTDDSVMAIAIYTAAKNCIDRNLKEEEIIQEYAAQMRKFAIMYPNAGYGSHFREWALCGIEDEEYQSFGDGSAMRSGVLGAMFERVEDVILHAACASYPTHAHPEGMKGGIVTAVLVWMALNGMSAEKMRKYIIRHYPNSTPPKKYFNQVSAVLSIEEVEEPDKYNTLMIDCMTAVPLAWINFYDSMYFEDCIRNGLRYSSDTDTVMAISGGIAAAFYSPKTHVQEKELHEIAKEYLDDFLWEQIHQ